MDYLEELLHKYCERIAQELDEKFASIENVPKITPQDLEVIDMLLHSLKSIKTVLAMPESDNRYSGTYYPRRSGNYNYSGTNRNSMGRYTRDNDKASMMDMLENKLRNVKSEDEAMAIKDAMDAISRLK